jgi:hypothetical protein
MAQGVSAAVDAVSYFRTQLRAAGSRKRAASAKAYLKSELRFYGASVPAVRTIAADYSRSNRDLTRAQLREIADAAYDTDVNEIRSAAIALLERRRDLLSEADLPWLIAIVRRSDTWARAGVIGRS